MDTYRRMNHKGIEVVYRPKKWAMIGVCFCALGLLFNLLLVMVMLTDTKNLREDSMLAIWFILSPLLMLLMFLNLYKGDNTRIKYIGNSIFVRRRRPWFLLLTNVLSFFAFGVGAFCFNIPEDYGIDLFFLIFSSLLTIGSIFLYLGRWKEGDDIIYIPVRNTRKDSPYREGFKQDYTYNPNITESEPQDKHTSTGSQSLDGKSGCQSSTYKF